MALGFPAYHTQVYRFLNASIDRMSVMQNALFTLHWQIGERSATSITAKVGTNWLSWGEKVTIELIDSTSVSLTSQCAFPTQCFDWGKNRTNIETLISQLQKSDSGEAPGPPPLPARVNTGI